MMDATTAARVSASIAGHQAEPACEEYIEDKRRELWMPRKAQPSGRFRRLSRKVKRERLDPDLARALKER